MTKYHTIKFVLDIAYEDHNKLLDKEQDWDKWVKYIRKMFNNDIPVALLKGLAKKNNTHLSRCLDSIVVIKKETRGEEKIKAYNSWIKRRDDGNTRVELEKELEKRKQYEKYIIQKRQECEKYCNEMQPIWDATIKKIINDRKNVEDSLWNKITRIK